MKNLTITALVLLTLILTSCNQNNQNTTCVTLNLENLEVDSVNYYLSKESKLVYSFWDWKSAPVDSLGTAKISFENSETNILLINVRKDTFWQPIRLLIRPKENYKINIDPKSKETLEILGNFKEGQTAFSKLERYTLCSGFDQEYMTEMLPENLLNIVQQNIENEISYFQKLYDSNKIDKEFFNVLKTDIETFHSYKLLTTLESRHRRKCGNYTGCRMPDNALGLDAHELKYIRLVDTLFSLYPINKESIWLSSELDGYLENYIWYKSLVDTTYSESKSEYNREILLAKKHLNPDFYEYYYASKFNMFNTTIETVQQRFKDFKAEFPESFYAEGIESSIKKIQAFLERKQGIKL